MRRGLRQTFNGIGLDRIMLTGENPKLTPIRSQFAVLGSAEESTPWEAAEFVVDYTNVVRRSWDLDWLPS